MSSKKVVIVFGTRPEAIKMAPLVKEFLKYSKHFIIKVCVTGQHRSMLDQVLSLFEITPDYDLDIMEPRQDLYDITSKVLLGLRNVYSIEKPDLVLVHGDTATSTAAALAAFYQKIPVAHIEAGLRTDNIYSPWPEEMNRQITGRIASYHFTPTGKTKNNLLREGVDKSKIIVTGNTVIDSLLWANESLKNNSNLNDTVIKILETNRLSRKLIFSWFEKKRKMVLITAHRRENFGEGILNISKAIKNLAQRFHDVDFLYPMHLNPNIRVALKQVFGSEYNLKNNSSNVYFIEPVDYLPFVFLMDCSYIVLTDSGGVQEEAPSLGKPVLLMRDNTERPEALEAGTVKLVGSDWQNIFDSVSKLLMIDSEYEIMAVSNNPYGDGKACERIVSYFLQIYFQASAI